MSFMLDPLKSVPTARSCGTDGNVAGWWFRPRFTIANILELIFCLGFLLSLARLYHWIPALMVGGAAFFFTILGSTRHLALKPKVVISVLLALCLWGALFFEWALFKLVESKMRERIGTDINLPMIPLCLASVPLITTAFLLGTRSYGSLALYLLLSPMFFGACRGVIDYVQGDAALPGRFGLVQKNPDRITRLTRPPEHQIRATAWFQDIAYEDALIVLSRAFGPLPGTYTGPYPTESEAREALASSRVITSEELASNIVDLHGERIFLDGLRGCLAPQSKYGPDSLTIVVWQHDCIIIGDRWSGNGQIYSINLYSRTTGKRFAHYGN